MKSLSIANKLWLPVIALAVIVGVIIATSVARIKSSQVDSQAEQQQQQSKVELALRWRGLTETNAARAAAGILSSDPVVAQTLKPDIDATTAKISEIQKSLEALATSDEEKAAMAAIAQTRAAYIAVRSEVVKIKSGGDIPAAVDALKARMLPAVATYLDAQQAFVKLQQARSDLMRDAVSVDRMRTVWSLATILSLVVLGLATGSWFLVRSISGPLATLARQAERIGGGDLSGEIDVSRGDEIGEVQRALAAMQDSLNRVVGEVRHSADSIQTASSEIATGNLDLSQRTELTASNLQHTASSMSQLTGTVRQSAESAATANQLASSAASVAQRGGDVVNQVVKTMDEINASSKKISDIIGTIDGIAFQTNILALNAAVEAARAGEQGRGFAVVASEVRSLAQRSAEAAKEIKSLIGSSVDKVETGARLVQDAGTTMTEIVASVGKVTDIIGEIRASTVAQSEGIDSVNTAVGQLDQMTQQNAALVEESAAAAESLRDQAGKLAGLVSGFKLQGQTVSKTAGRAAVQAPAKFSSKLATPPKPQPKPLTAKPAAPKPVLKTPATAKPSPKTTPPADDGDWASF